MNSPAHERRAGIRRGSRIVVIVLVAGLGWFSWSMGHALISPGGGTLAERAAEWARDHYLGPLVTLGEWASYKSPRTGGRPAFPLGGPGGASSDSSPAAGAAARPSGRAASSAPAALSSPAGRPLPGEGRWRVLYHVRHGTAIFGTYLRPDRTHTSYVAAVVSMNQRLLRFELRPGAEDPGPGSYGGAQAVIAPGTRSGLAATFNGGFKMAAAGGGFYLNGSYRGALRPGAASMVYYRDGHLAIGSWGHQLGMTREVVGIRQNLRLIVENGQIPAAVDQNVVSTWGATLGGGYYVWRSGVGITREGRVVFVYGPALDVRTLAGLLRRAGSVEAMQLDINPDWTNFMYYRPGRTPANPVPASLLPGQVQPAGRYYAQASRDFTAVFAR
jgi:hypothetical protein